ncbi:MAG TPA: hypothetical protein VM366_04165, partial [Anaerolineae bacterium]|nr:hypothetical protein [Anaerolineae bacterium]
TEAEIYRVRDQLGEAVEGGVYAQHAGEDLNTLRARSDIPLELSRRCGEEWTAVDGYNRSLLALPESKTDVEAQLIDAIQHGVGRMLYVPDAMWLANYSPFR